MLLSLTLLAFISILISVGSVQGNGMPSTLAVYASSKSGVLDLNWDNSVKNLIAELCSMGLGDVYVATEGQPGDLSSYSSFIIPTQTGPVLYSEAENMEDLRSFVETGGLVIILDASQHGNFDAVKTVASRALGYNGEWSTCRVSTPTLPQSKRFITLDDRASNFLASATLPREIEDGVGITARTFCLNTDPAASSWPLYTIKEDTLATVAQAFGMRGKMGAVVWLGYDWKQGPKQGWGRLVKALIEAFLQGTYRDPAEAERMQDTDFTLEKGFHQILDKLAADMAEATDEVIGRVLQQDPAPAYPPSPSPLPPSSPPPEPVYSVTFKWLLGMGIATDQSQRPIVWFDDTDFKLLRKPRNQFNLIYWTKLNECNVTFGTCSQCPRAWQVDNSTRNVTLLFREPWQLDAIHITQLQNPGVLTVQLLPWPAVNISGLDLRPQSGLVNPPNWNVTVDNTTCGGTLRIPLGKRAGTGLRVPKRGSQEKIPEKLQSTTLGGINILIKAQPRNGANPPGNTFIESVRFDGRVLYPIDPALYGPDHP